MGKIIFSLLLVIGWPGMSGQFVMAQMYFPPVTGTWEEDSPETLGWCADSMQALYDWLEIQNTKAFVVLHNGRLITEKYFGTHDQITPWYWASAGKTMRALLFGIAQREGSLKLDERVSKHVDTGWTNCCLDKELQIKLQHLLCMTSGLDDDVNDPFCSDDTCLRYLVDAGSRWAYHNGPYNLTKEVLESATGESLNEFTKSRVLDLTGMSGTWIPSGYNTVFWSNARSMARFGHLILNGGDWGVQPVLADTGYYDDMTNTSQTLNPAYGYLWWLNGKSKFMIPGSQLKFDGPLIPQAPDDLIAALGQDDQKIYISPSKALVVVRQGAATNYTLPTQFDRALWEKLSNLSCETGSVPPNQFDFIDFQYDPAKRMIECAPVNCEIQLDVLDLYGRPALSSLTGKANLAELSSGVYVVRISISKLVMAYRRIVLP